MRHFSVLLIALFTSVLALGTVSTSDAFAANNKKERKEIVAVSEEAAPAAAESEAIVPAATEERSSDATPLYQIETLKVIGQAKPWQLGFQQGVTPSKHAINDLHYWVTVVMTFIVIFVTILLTYVCVRFRRSANPVASKVSHNTLVEVVWTVIPILILVAIAIPSLRAHYGVINNLEKADMTLKIVGHQWYWSYEYPEEGIAFDSNIKKEEELKDGEPRLLAVDNPIYVPVDTKVRIQITSADVIHNWAMPSFGIKKDAVPGRLNETWFKAEKPGIYYGQCSELCGKFHGFMPIEVRVVSKAAYASWVKDAKVKFAEQRYGTEALALNQ